MTPAFYVPLYFNIILFGSGIGLASAAMYFLITKAFPWFVNLPLLVYGIHFSIFYGLITFAELTGHLLNNETMTFWSAILRFHGVATAIVMIFILYLMFGVENNGKRKS